MYRKKLKEEKRKSIIKEFDSLVPDVKVLIGNRIALYSDWGYMCGLFLNAIFKQIAIYTVIVAKDIDECPFSSENVLYKAKCRIFLSKDKAIKYIEKILNIRK